MRAVYAPHLPALLLRLLALGVAVAATGGLAGCGWEPPGALLAADAASVVVFGRSIADLGISAITGRDCSIVRLDRRQTYCASVEPTMREAYCTHSLGVVDCWTGPAALPIPEPNVADTPLPTPAQERYRAARWPKSINAMP